MGTKIICVAMQKGGTGKTSTAAAIAHAAAKRELKTLVVDLDPQGNLTYTMGANAKKPGSLEFLGGRPAATVMQSIAPNLTMISANENLATIKSEKGSANRLRSALEPLKRLFDVIIIDTPPTAGELQYNALQAATDVVIPLQADVYNVPGFQKIVNTVNMIKTSNPELKIAGYVLTQYNGRSSLAQQMAEVISQEAEKQGVKCLGVIRSAVAVREAAALKKSLFDYAPKNKAAAEYLTMFDELMK